MLYKVNFNKLIITYLVITQTHKIKQQKFKYLTTKVINMLDVDSKKSNNFKYDVVK